MKKRLTNLFWDVIGFLFWLGIIGLIHLWVAYEVNK